jgi:hypothetical protein
MACVMRRGGRLDITGHKKHSARRCRCIVARAYCSCCTSSSEMLFWTVVPSSACAECVIVTSHPPWPPSIRCQVKSGMLKERIKFRFSSPQIFAVTKVCFHIHPCYFSYLSSVSLICNFSLSSVNSLHLFYLHFCEKVNCVIPKYKKEKKSHVFNPLKPSGNYMPHLLRQSVILHFVFMCFVWFSV